MKKIQQPIDCVLGVTYNCNSRCTMCNIWKIKNSPELPVKEYEKLPRSLRDINISGGEPFLRD
ncbi:MAG: radical SAM protein, partial [Candidatus Magasanikbacteria bacterium]|nr:radical SAM protein [Candidatus Magasanikbacteria bacterium]